MSVLGLLHKSINVFVRIPDCAHIPQMYRIHVIFGCTFEVYSFNLSLRNTMYYMYLQLVVQRHMLKPKYVKWKLYMYTDWPYLNTPADLYRLKICL